eukprot:TRINITY_DN11269_c0_g3_i10.p1 TRINITY_DN11269_c0_g3~~TRINITY_DN11269_c0_g3_i10.p1  ORF type:complete len:284 (+),score=16.72 TRINITY_DN11269_c0_g3_i10:588-1439(+)
MKFKAKASGAASMLVLQQTAMTFSKASKSRYVGIHITPEHIYFLVLRSDRRQSDNLWVEIDQTHLFDVFVLQSLHANREILFRLQVDHLVKALTSAVESNNVTLKLTKRDHATCLTISIGSMAASGITRPIIQDIPVEIYPHEEIADNVPPTLADPAVNIMLPDNRKLKTILDRMKSMSHTVTVTANHEGCFVLRVQSDLISVKTSFKDLENPIWRDDHGLEGSPSDFIEGNVDARKMTDFVNGALQIRGSKIMLSIIPNSCVVLTLAHDDISLTYPIPMQTA